MGKLKKSTWQLGYPWDIHGLGQVKYGTPSDYLAFVLYFLVIIFSKTLRLWIYLDQMWRKLASIGVVGPSIALLGPQMPKPHQILGLVQNSTCQRNMTMCSFWVHKMFSRYFQQQLKPVSATSSRDLSIAVELKENNHQKVRNKSLIARWCPIFYLTQIMSTPEYPIFKYFFVQFPVNIFSKTRRLWIDLHQTCSKLVSNFFTDQNWPILEPPNPKNQYRALFSLGKKVFYHIYIHRFRSGGGRRAPPPLFEFGGPGPPPPPGPLGAGGAPKTGRKSLKTGQNFGGASRRL